MSIYNIRFRWTKIRSSLCIGFKSWCDFMKFFLCFKAKIDYGETNVLDNTLSCQLIILNQQVSSCHYHMILANPIEWSVIDHLLCILMENGLLKRYTRQCKFSDEHKSRAICFSKKLSKIFWGGNNLSITIMKHQVQISNHSHTTYGWVPPQMTKLYL